MVSQNRFITNYQPNAKDNLAQDLIDTLNLSPNVNTSNIGTTADNPQDNAQWHFVGQSYDFVGSRIFGGQLIAQALMAAAASLNFVKTCHSLHCYFLQAGDVNYPVYYSVHRLRDGKSLSARHISAQQIINGHARTLFIMTASFTRLPNPSDTSDDQNITKAKPSFGTPMPTYPPAEQLPCEQTLKTHHLADIPKPLQARYLRKNPVTFYPIHPRHPITPAPMPPHHAFWVVATAVFEQLQGLTDANFGGNLLAQMDTVADNLIFHQALLAFLSDYHLLGACLLPHALSYSDRCLQMASIDHTMHFYRPFDLTKHCLYDIHADNLSFDKGVAHGKIWQNGQIIASTSQEGLIRLKDGGINGDR